VQLVRREGGTMESLQPCRLSDAAACQALVDFALRKFSRIDVLFNNAAMAYFNLARGHQRRGVGSQSSRRGRPGLLPDARGVAAPQSQRQASS